jgi:hypothetical protein
MIAVKADPAYVMQATTQTLRKMAQLTGFSQRTVLLGFAGVVLKTWAGRTKVATKEKADRRSRLRAIRGLGYTKGSERGDVTVNAGYRPAPFGRVWIRVRNGGGRKSWILAKGANFSAPTGTATFSLAGRQLYNPKKRGDSDRSTSFQWMENVNHAQTNVEHAISQAIPRGRASIGLARQSVVQIADGLGIDLLRVQGGGTLSSQGLDRESLPQRLRLSGREWRLRLRGPHQPPALRPEDRHGPDADWGSRRPKQIL